MILYTHIHTHTCTHTHTYTHHTHTHRYIYTYTHIHTHIHTHTHILLMCVCVSVYIQGFPDGSVVKNPPANAGDAGSISGLATHSSILAWRIPWTGEPSGLQSMGSQKSQTKLSN